MFLDALSVAARFVPWHAILCAIGSALDAAL